MNILFDTNVVLDVFLKRSPWNVQAEELIEHHIKNTITIHLSTLTLADMAYVGRRLLPPDRIRDNL